MLTFRNNLIESLFEGINKIKVDPNREFDIVYRNENMLLVAPRTRSAACKYGSGTKWCSADPNRGPDRWRSFEEIRKDFILFYLILYKDTPEGKIEDYKISIEKKVSSGSEKWVDIIGKRINNIEMFRKFILTDPNVEKSMNDYWKNNRIDWRPKFDIGDYIQPKKNYGMTTFIDTEDKNKFDFNWSDVICVVVGESKARLLIQIVRMSNRLYYSTSEYDKKRKDKVQSTLENHRKLQKWVNPYLFEKIK